MTVIISLEEISQNPACVAQKLTAAGFPAEHIPTLTPSDIAKYQEQGAGTVTFTYTPQ